MSFIKFKRSKILVLMVVLTMVLSCSAVMADSEGIPAGESGVTIVEETVQEGVADDSNANEENYTEVSSNQDGTDKDTSKGEAFDNENINLEENSTDEGNTEEGSIVENDTYSDNDEESAPKDSLNEDEKEAETEPMDGSPSSAGNLEASGAQGGSSDPVNEEGKLESENPADKDTEHHGNEFSIAPPQPLLAPMAAETEVDDDNDYLDFTLIRIRSVDGSWQEIYNDMPLLAGQEYEIEYKAANTFEQMIPLTFVNISKIKLTVEQNGEQIVSQSISDLRSPEKKNTPPERIGTYTFVAQEGQHTLVNKVDGRRKVAFWLDQSAQVSFTYQAAVLSSAQGLRVELHSVHVGASSLHFERNTDDGGLAEPVVWHFVLNKVNNNNYLNLKVKFAGNQDFIDVPADTKHKTNPVQHFFVGTASHDILEGAYVEGAIAKNQNEPQLNLSHVRIVDILDPADPEDPSDPGEPGETEDPDNPNNPEDPEDPGDGDPEEPGDPVNPEDPGDPEKPNDPGNPENPDDPQNPNDPEDPGDSDSEDTDESDGSNDPDGSNSSGGGSTGGGSSGSSGGSNENTVTIEPEPTAVLPEPEQEVQILPELVAIEPEQEIEVQPEAAASGPELPRTGGSALAFIFSSLAAGSGILLMTRSRKDYK